ncbi:adenylate/guanylate cyclase domain-containing protein [Spirulina subsalsa]|uniref:adenylate/guanylate cyclase domain-containing protein n=1 Tax=Spirulina subsalsa TaxID=54311 RepID=UPI002236FD2F|nr:adenylate/guanylate cyclase domain-containing protein [Spirulina subsalsa]
MWTEDQPDSYHSDPALTAFFDLSPDLLCVRHHKGYFTHLNALWTEILGWSLEELRSRPWVDFVHPDDLIATLEIEEQCHHASSPIKHQNRYLSKNGGYRWLSWRLSPYQQGQSFGIAQDVTDNYWQNSELYRAGVQEALKLRDQAIAASSVGIVIANTRLPDMPLIYVNPAFEQITGYSAEEVLGLNCRFLQCDQTDQNELQRLREAIKAGKHCTVTLLNQRKDGTPFWNELTISPIYNSQQELTHFVGVQTDISDRINAEQALRLEKAKSERLLLNVLPRSIVQQLKQCQGTLAEQFPEVSILFADIVGFTTLAAQMQPLELISLLNQIFSAFDELADRHGVEKIKTIGDAYMVASGLPVARDDHAEAIAEMALDMITALQSFRTRQGIPLHIRIGINTGTVVAGVIGTRKFIYDLWGDAVNVASRMESSGLPSKIQVTAATYKRLQGQYHLEERGLIAVKGKGKMTTYWLTGRKTAK